MVDLIVALAGIVLYVGLWSVVFGKAGYSRSLGLLMVVPLVNVIWILIFVFSEWPIRREEARLRLVAGEGTEDDASCVLDHASKLDQRGEWDQAISLCELAAQRMQGQPISEDAKIFIEGVREKQALAS